jgi:hypothetical protein
MPENSTVYGLMAEFDSIEALIAAARRTHEDGYHRFDAYSPMPNEELTEAMELGSTLIPPVVLLSGILGGAGGLFMMWFANVVHYPINVGGRPLNSWPAFVPIMFELTVLCAALAAFAAMLILNRLPMPHHPVFNVPDFDQASTDRFFLCIEAADHRFDLSATRAFLQSLHPRIVTEVPI